MIKKGLCFLIAGMVSCMVYAANPASTDRVPAKIAIFLEANQAVVVNGS